MRTDEATCVRCGFSHLNALRPMAGGRPPYQPPPYPGPPASVYDARRVPARTQWWLVALVALLVVAKMVPLLRVFGVLPPRRYSHSLRWTP